MTEEEKREVQQLNNYIRALIEAEEHGVELPHMYFRRQAKMTKERYGKMLEEDMKKQQLEQENKLKASQEKQNSNEK